MTQDNKRFEEAVIKDNLFHQQLSNVRNHTVNADQELAMSLLRQPKEKTIFSEPEPAKVVLTIDEVERMAFYDDSAPVYNFRYLMRKLKHEICRSQRFNRPVAVAMLAVDGLTRIGPEYGTLAEDTAVIGVAELLNDSIRTD